MNLRLGFHYHIPMYTDETETLRTSGYFGRFLDSLAAECETLICFMHSPRADEVPQMDYAIQAQNLIWVDIGPHVSVPQRMMSAHKITAALRKRCNQLDAMLIRGPSPLLPAMSAAAGALPLALLIVGDYMQGIDDLPQPRWRKEAIRVWSYFNYLQQLNAAKRALTFVNSRALYEQFQPHLKHLVETRTTTLSQADFYEREDTCQQSQIRLLYTGRIDRAKGLFEMVQAIEVLSANGYDVLLDLVGWPAKGDTIVDELIEDARKRNIEHRILYHGFKSVGPELFAYYKRADVYLLASRKSEGFPRTIWEAMAHSVPVIATKVGSIPHFLTHQQTAWIIRPKSSEEIANAVHILITDDVARKRLIVQARELVRENTLEYRSAELYRHIHEWVNRHE